MAKRTLCQFDPDKVARLDTALWRAYYRHHFLTLLWLLVQTMRLQFGLKLSQAIPAAYYSGKAAIDFKKDSSRGDYRQSLEDLYVLFSFVRKHTHETFNHKRVAELELEWWLVHRYPKSYQHTLPTALARAMAALYMTDIRRLEEYGRRRAQAMDLRDIAVWNMHTEPDWAAIECHLRAAYRSLHRVINR